VASDVRTTLAALQTLLAANLGTVDLSATGRVQIGSPVRGAPLPCAWIDVRRVDSKRSEELGSWRRDLTVEIQVWVPASSGAAESKLFAALDALDDVTTQLQTSAAIGVCLDSGFTGCVLDGSRLEMPGVAVAFIEWKGWWESTSLVGT
jgi:hypothetical protein